ncbi:MAG TPA: hypothetical protein DEB31_05905 [Clostridiales bacterium]|nr:hypothetical protein [Clostridiales bacterium]
MMRALFSGVTGLRSHQTRMDVIGNNISNVNTLGYKTSSANFADLYSETVTSASAPTGNTGGTNARQIGLGTNVNSIVIRHSPGAAQYTGNTLDLAITGDGFFVLSTPNGERYSRAGNLSISSNGSLVNPSGFYVQAYTSRYQAGTAGKVTPVGLAGTTSFFNNFAYDSTTAPAADNIASMPAGSYTLQVQDDGTVNLMRGGIVIEEGLQIEKFDITGAMSEGFIDDAAVDFTNDAMYKINITDGTDRYGTISFTIPAGAAVPTGANAAAAKAAGILDMKKVIDNLSLETENNDGFIASNQRGNMVIDQDLYENIMINEQGAVIGQLKREAIPEFDGVPIDGAMAMARGEKVVLGYVALANFTNQEGLEKIATNLYAASTNSGRVTYNLPGEGGTGSLTPSSLEMSNTDLSEEMVNMITTQRGFQANSRIITTTDTMLEELVNLKR